MGIGVQCHFLATFDPPLSPFPFPGVEGARQVVRASMLKHCSQSDTVVAVPRRVVDGLGVRQMTLGDKKCAADKNSTHWVLKSPR